MTTNEIVSEVLEYRGKISLIGIVARLTEDGDMVQLIRILSE